MTLRWLVFYLLLCTALPGRAQPHGAAPAGSLSLRALEDSMRVLHHYGKTHRDVAAERLANYLLTNYPEEYGADSHYSSGFNYPSVWPRGVQGYSNGTSYRPAACAYRAELRRRRGDYAGAEADLTTLIGYGLRAKPLALVASAQYLLPQAYYERAALRRQHLRNPSGSCADLAAGYELDPRPADSMAWHGCPPIRTHAPRNQAEQKQAQRACTDSLQRVQHLLAAGRLAQAETLLRQLDSGHVGPYAWVWPESNAWVRPISRVYLWSQLARQRGQYGQAQVLLDSLLAQPITQSMALYPEPLSRYRYALGTLKIDHLNDRAGGCADLLWAFEHSADADTATWHPHWRGCPLPRLRQPIRYEDIKAYQKAYGDSLELARLMLGYKQFAAAERLLTGLLTTRAAGRFAAPKVPPPFTSFDQEILPSHLPRQARDYRSQVYESLGQYARAAADLDTLIGPVEGNWSNVYHCRRGVLRADYLHDKEGACADFAKCYRARHQNTWQPPPGWPGWRGCYLPERTLDQQLFSGLSWDAEGTLRVGYFSQGAVKGADIGYFLAKEGADYSLYGASAGLEVGGGRQQFILAPKLSYEATASIIGGRLDMAYYTNFKTGDLRLTPQAGFSLWGMLNVFYGYALPLTGARLPGLGEHRLSIYINFYDNGPGFKIGG